MMDEPVDFKFGVKWNLMALYFIIVGGGGGFLITSILCGNFGQSIPVVALALLLTLVWGYYAGHWAIDFECWLDKKLKI